MNQTNLIVQSLYHNLLCRCPDSDGYKLYSNLVQNGTPLFLIIQNIAKSKEFLQFHLSKLKNITEKQNQNVVNVFMCVRNNSNSLHKTFGSLLDLIRKFRNFEFVFYIYENDSDDDTTLQVLNFFKLNDLKGSFRSDRKFAKQWQSIQSMQRSNDMAKYRNAMKNLCDDFSDSEFSVIIDTDIEFSASTFQQMMHVMSNNPHIAMVTPYAYVDDTFQYYDTYALDAELQVCPLMPEKINVNSAFGGFVMVRSAALAFSNWSTIPDKLCSEHNFFCKMVSRFGSIALFRDIRVRWKKA